MQSLLQCHIVDNRTVNTHTDNRFILKRFDMDITTVHTISTLEQRIQQVDDRSLIITIFHRQFFEIVLLLIGHCIGCTCRLLRSDF